MNILNFGSFCVAKCIVDPQGEFPLAAVQERPGTTLRHVVHGGQHYVFTLPPDTSPDSFADYVREHFGETATEYRLATEDVVRVTPEPVRPPVPDAPNELVTLRERIDRLQAAGRAITSCFGENVHVRNTSGVNAHYVKAAKLLAREAA